jgi:predicted Zn-dependent protease
MSDTPGAARLRPRRGGSYAPWAIGLGALAGTVAAVIWFLVLQGPKMGTPDLAEASDCMGQGDLDCAEADFRAWLVRHPDDASANSLMAIALSRDGKDKEALPYFQRSVQLGVATYDFDETYAGSLRKLGDIDGAIRLDQAALAIRPDLKDVRARLADELVSRGRAAEALTLLQSYDSDLTSNYRQPVFTAQIAKIRAQMAQGTPASTAAAGPRAP